MSNKEQKLDFSQINEVSGGDEEFKKELIEIFKKQIPEFIENLKKYLLEDNLEKLANVAHTAKSSSLIFGMITTGTHLKDIQLFAEAGKKEQLSSLVKQVVTDFSDVLEILDEELKI